MKLSILVMITNPEKRQDRWREAFDCYVDLADEVIVVDGSGTFKDGTFGVIDIKDTNLKTGEVRWTNKIKIFYLKWPEEWNWIELPKHLNAGLEECTGDWVLKLDIDQFIHEDDFEAVKSVLRRCPEDCDVVTFQKMNMTYGGKYFQKGGQPIAFRNKPNIKIGKNTNRRTDLCFAVNVVGSEVIDGYKMPVGNQLKEFKGGVKYWNYDYFFKTKDFTKKEFWRFSRAWHRYYNNWQFGSNEKQSFKIFLDGMKGKHHKSPYTYELKDHPKYIREAVKNLTKEQFGHSAWGLL